MAPPKRIRSPLKNDAGISLLEILIVLAVIALIMGLVAPRLLDSFGRAKSQTAAIQMQNLKGAIQLMYIDISRLPSESEGLNLLMTAPTQLKGWRGPYLEDKAGLLDPWQRRYIYRQPGQDREFDIFTLGRDGQKGGTKEDADIFL
jgi:general secretion pathway protein G